jgi:hypothetical protein
VHVRVHTNAILIPARLCTVLEDLASTIVRVRCTTPVPSRKSRKFELRRGCIVTANSKTNQPSASSPRLSRAQTRCKLQAAVGIPEWHEFIRCAKLDTQLIDRGIIQRPSSTMVQSVEWLAARSRPAILAAICAFLLLASPYTPLSNRSPSIRASGIPQLDDQRHDHVQAADEQTNASETDEQSHIDESPSLPWCSGVSVSDAFSDDMLLQRDARAAVYGTVQASADTGASLGSSRHVWVDVMRDGGDADAVVVSQSSTNLVRGRSKSGDEWKVVLPPQPAGTGYSLRVYCGGTRVGSPSGPQVQILRVAFGDVYFCGGQSNMWLALHRTFEGEATLQRLKSSPHQLRLMHRPTDASTKQVFVGADRRHVGPWLDLAREMQQQSQQQHSTHGGKKSTTDEFIINFSGTCLYFGLSLLDRLGPDAPPIGLIQSCVGGSWIEEWASISDLSGCSDQTLQHKSGSHAPEQYFNGMVAPLVNMTLRGWVYYQGESNVVGVAGNSARDTGYGCTMPTLIASWRRWWSVEPDTTPTSAVFGLVTLAAGTDEGFPAKMSAFRWSQTANYGVAPNPKMPNVSQCVSMVLLTLPERRHHVPGLTFD